MRKQQVTEVSFMECHAVDVVRVAGEYDFGAWSAAVCARAEFAADGDACGETDDCAADSVGYQGADRAVDVAWVGGEERAEYDEDFARAVGRGVEERGSCHFKGVLERWVASGFLGTKIC